VTLQVGRRRTAESTSGAGPTRPALAGVLAAAAALGVAELVAGLLRGAPSLLLAVGDAVIDSVPGDVERRAIALLGQYDKPVLVGGILVVSAVVGAVLGVLAVRRLAVGAAGLVGFAVLGGVAALADPRAELVPTMVVVLAGAATGLVSLRLLVVAVAGTRPVGGRDLDRRGFLRGAIGIGAVAAFGGFGGQWLQARERINDLRAAIRLPAPVRPAPPAPSAASLDVPGLTPLYVSNEDFYRIDTALRVPQVDPRSWTLEVRGMVDRPFTLTYDELLALPQVEADVTLACVSNRVGGDLVGNARWQGVPLRRLLERAGVRDGATQVLSRSVDGFTAGFPTVIALARDEAMVAVAMNGEPLPAAHGFPARLVVPGLYGYVSATKWLSVLELNDFSRVDGYWIPRGWAKEGPVVTQSRIDVPRSSATVSAGRVAVAGVAWAPTRGISRVEVRVDGGPWREAELAAPLDVDCWRQWVYSWDAAPGEHELSVRATDGEGDVQTAVETPVAPSGATGHHTITVEVAPA